MNPVLAYLLPRTGSWVSGMEVSKELGISRAAVWKHIHKLRALGCTIETSPRHGYRLNAGGDILAPETIDIRTKILGTCIVFSESVTSTNEVATKMARSAKDGTLVLSLIQTAGMGRLQRSWSSPPGGIWMSLILKPEIPPVLSPRIGMMAAVAVASALRRAGFHAKIKWPNDILIGDRKVCGILIELGAQMDRLEYAVVGIGINANVNDEALLEEWGATSLGKELGRTVDRSEIISCVLEELELRYLGLGAEFQEIHREWEAFSATLGQEVMVIGWSGNGDLAGKAESLDQDGALIVGTSQGLVRVLAGDCRHLRPLNRSGCRSTAARPGSEI